LFVNKAYAELFGYESPEEIKALPPFALVAPHDRERLRRKRQGLLAGKPTPLSHDYDGVRKDGSIIQLESFGRRLVWQGEDAIQRTCVDVTRQRRAEADLK
jgi:PAS domain S-box-containing protein